MPSIHKPSVSIINFMLCSVLILLMCLSNMESASGQTLQAGVAKVKTTPESPVTMSGYGGRDEPFKGVHDDLYTRAIVFSNGTRKALVIAADIIGLSRDYCLDLKKSITEKTGIPGEYIVIAATHTHGGPTTGTYEKQSDAVRAYVASLNENMLNASVTANANLKPVTIGSGRGECLMNINRRARTAKGGIELGRNPYGACDHDVAVLKIQGEDGKPIGIFINWPCHGTVLGPRNYLITGDWPGAAARFVEENLGDGVIAPVTAGASGNINPIYGPHIDFEDAKDYAYGMEATGMYVGEEAIRVANEADTFPNAAISAASRVITLKGKKRGESNAPPQNFEPADDFEVVLTALKIGNVVFAGISGEVFTEIGEQIKKLSPYASTIVITHCNGSSGYLVTDAAYKEGGYEVRTTRGMPGTEKALVDNMIDMINQLE